MILQGCEMWMNNMAYFCQPPRRTVGGSTAVPEEEKNLSKFTDVVGGLSGYLWGVFAPVVANASKDTDFQFFMTAGFGVVPPVLAAFAWNSDSIFGESSCSQVLKSGALWFLFTAAAGFTTYFLISSHLKYSEDTAIRRKWGGEKEEEEEPEKTPKKRGRGRPKKSGDSKKGSKK